MHARPVFSTVLLLLSSFAAGFVGVGCTKKTSENVSAEATAYDAARDHRGPRRRLDRVEAKPDGKVRALVKTGRRQARRQGDRHPRHAALERARARHEGGVDLDDKTSSSSDRGQKLEGDLTEIRYTVTVAGSAWTGALHVPAGGTDDLDESAKRATARPAPKGKKGPNGGIVQVVGATPSRSSPTRTPARCASTSSTRPTSRSRSEAAGASSASWAAASRRSRSRPARAGVIPTGQLVTKIDPVKLTIAISAGDHTEVALAATSPTAWSWWARRRRRFTCW